MKVLLSNIEDTFTKIKNIFYGGGYAFTGNQQSAKNIAFLVDNKYIELTEYMYIYFRQRLLCLFNKKLTPACTGA